MSVFAWHKAIRDAPISPTAKLVAYTLGTYMDKRGECWPGVDRLAAGCGKSPRTVQRALRDIEHAGLVAVAWRGRVTPIYTRRMVTPVTRGGDTDAERGDKRAA